MSTHIHRCEVLHTFCEAIRQGEPTLFTTFGDSNTCNAHYSQGDKQWGELLHSELRDQLGSQSVLYLNGSISGDCTIRGLKRWYSDFDRFHADLIFAMGTNDRRLKPAEFHDAIERTLDRCEAMGTRVLMRTPIPIIEFEPAPAHLWPDDKDLRERVDIIREIADTYALPLVDVYADWWDQEKAGTLNAPELFGDAVHTNGNGHRQVARSILPAFGLEPTFTSAEQKANLMVVTANLTP